MSCATKYAVVHNIIRVVRLFVILMKVYIFRAMSYYVIRLWYERRTHVVRLLFSGFLILFWVPRLLWLTYTRIIWLSCDKSYLLMVFYHQTSRTRVIRQSCVCCITGRSCEVFCALLTHTIQKILTFPSHDCMHTQDEYFSYILHSLACHVEHNFQEICYYCYYAFVTQQFLNVGKLHPSCEANAYEQKNRTWNVKGP